MKDEIIVSRNVIYKITFKKLLKRLELEDKKLIGLWVNNFENYLEITVEEDKK